MRRPRLFLDAQHGLCNRLRAIASGAVIAQQTGRQLMVIWRPDHHCEGRLGDILRAPFPVIEEAAAADLMRARSAIVYNYMEIEPGARFQEPVLPDAATDTGGDVYVRSAYTLVSPHRDFARERAFLRSLQPTAAVQDLVNSVRHPSRVAAHVRMATGKEFDHLSYEGPGNWPEARHRELAQWRRTSSADRFIARLDALVGQGRAETIFLAADLPETYARFAARYGDRLRVLARDRFDRSAAQLHHALADLILLSAADLFLASTWSSFSDLAQWLARPGRAVEQSGEDF